MKYFLILFILISFNVFSQTKETFPTIWGTLYKTTKETHGHQYFIFFKKGGRNYAFPLSSESKINKSKLDKLNGKFAKIYAKESFERIDLEKTKHILTYNVIDAKELTLSDLNQNIEIYSEQQDIQKIYQRQITSDIPTKTGLSNKAINTAIFIGGTILAADVLSVLLTK